MSRATEVDSVAMAAFDQVAAMRQLLEEVMLIEEAVGGGCVRLCPQVRCEVEHPIGHHADCLISRIRVVMGPPS